MDPCDYPFDQLGQRNWMTILLTIIRYFLLIVLIVSGFILITTISTFLLDQNSWSPHQPATSRIWSTLYSSKDTSNLSSLPTSSSSVSSSVTTINNKIQSDTSLDPDEINIRVQLFQIKSALSLVYLALGFISIISADYYLCLFFTFTSHIGFLVSLVRSETNTPLNIELVIYLTIMSIFSLLYCVLIKISLRPQTPYYYGYLQA